MINKMSQPRFPKGSHTRTVMPKYKLGRKVRKSIKQLSRSINLSKKTQKVLTTHKKNFVQSHIWQNKWNNLHIHYKSLIISRAIKKFSSFSGLYLNKFYCRTFHDGIQILATNLGVFRAHKAKRKVNYYISKVQNKTPLSNLAKFIILSNKVSCVKLKLYNTYLPRKFIKKESIKVFKRHKKERFFWESLQLVNAVFKGYASATALGSLIYTHTRRNPRRIAFVAYIKRLLDWHFRTFRNKKIQGVRVEIKGRFNAKSRTKKHILSSGRVRIHEKSSNVDYARIDSFTKFGCLGIKVWICPK